MKIWKPVEWEKQVMSIKSLVKALKNGGGAGAALIDHIFADDRLPANEAAYSRSYFEEDIRRRVFNGSRVSGNMVVLSPAAAHLKDSFQSRYPQTGQFPPFTAYHATKDPNVANLIVGGGFRSAGETLMGSGVYFFHAKNRADDYAREAGNGAVLAVTIFGDVAVANPAALGADRVVLQTSPTRSILLVKNPLVIFPKAVWFVGG